MYAPPEYSIYVCSDDMNTIEYHFHNNTLERISPENRKNHYKQHNITGVCGVLLMIVAIWANWRGLSQAGLLPDRSGDIRHGMVGEGNSGIGRPG